MEEQVTLPKKSKKPFRIRPAQIIVLGFFAVILFGAFLLCLPISSQSQTWTHYGNALFTATSAVCVTGLIIFPTAVHFSLFGQIILLILIQVGGLGFMTLTTLFMMLIRKKITLKDRLVIKEALGQDDNRGIVRMTRNLVLLTFAIEFVGALIFLPVFIHRNGAIGIWQSIFTSVSAFCNAGFDIFGTAANSYQGLTGFSSNVLVSLNTCMLIILGGIGFTVIMDITKNKFSFKKISLHTKLVILVSGILILGGWIFFFCAEFTNSTMKNMNVGEKILASFFQSVTTRTAGFNTVDQSALTPASKLMSMLLMLIGASPGSTGGGIKTTSLALLILTVVAGIKKNEEIVIARHSVNPRTAFRAISVLALALVLIVATTMVLLITQKNNIPPDQFNLENLLFESFSAFGTVGLSTGLTPFLSGSGKIALMILMFLGRVGPITVGLMFLSKNGTDIKYPECSIMIG